MAGHITRTQTAWACLAAAVIKRAQDVNDQRFLQSQWCKDLTRMVELALEGSHDSGVPQSTVKKETT